MYMNAKIFKQAHELTKSIIQKGDNYRATFALCLKLVMSKITWVKEFPYVRSNKNGQRFIRIEVSQKSEFKNKTIAKASWGMIEVTGSGKEFTEWVETARNHGSHKTFCYAYVNEYEF